MKKTLKSVLALFFVVLTIMCTMTVASALDAPLAIKVKSVAHNSVTLYWTAVSKATDYELQRSTDAKTWTTIAKNVTGTQYTDSKSLTTGKPYAYRIRARKDNLLISDEYSAWTGAKACIATPVPAKVTGLKVKAAIATAIQLTWNKVAGANGYTVQFLSGSKWVNYKSVTGNSIVVSGVKLGTEYSFRVAAVKIVSGKWVYGPVSATLKASPVLPATSTVVLSGVNATQMRLQWAAVAGAKGYEVFNHTTGQWTNAGTKTVIILSGFQPAESCSFTVRAYAGAVKGAESKKYTFKTTPAVPTGLKIADATDNSLTYTWEPVAGAEGYQAAYLTRANGKWITLPLTTGTSATVTGLPALTECGFKVRAFVKNANVYNMNAYAISAYSKNLIGKTVLPATKAAAVKSTSPTDTKIKWNALTGAAGYIIEKCDLSFKQWTTYDFASNQWITPDKLTEANQIVTTATSFTDSGKSTRGEVYRVRAVDANGNKGTASNLVNAFTSDILMNDTNAVFPVQQTIRWPAVEGAVSYQVIARNPVTGSEEICTFEASKVARTDGTCQTSIYLAPNSIQSIMILSFDANNRTSTATNWVTFNIGAVPILASNHSYYVASVNSQLLYLAQAINNTKGYTGTITATNNSQVSYEVNSLKIPILLINKTNAKDVAEFFERFDESGEMPTSASETFSSTLTFTNGVAVNEDNRTVRLKSFVEPSSNGTQTAYLYNSQNFTAWKNGFDSVAAKKNADGSLTMQLKFKKETTNSNYHNGYMSSFSSNDFASGSGLSVKSLAVGGSILTVTIDKDGILKSYVASSPYTATFAANFTTEEDIKDDGINLGAGSLVTMEMGISGSTKFNYTFAR